MTCYQFEYYTRDGDLADEPWVIWAADSYDAFDMFRVDHPHAVIANIWVQAFKNYSVDAS